MKKKLLLLLVALSATVVFADGMDVSKMSDVIKGIDIKNLLKLPVGEPISVDMKDTIKCGKVNRINIPRELSEGAKCGALRVSHIFIDEKTNVICGGLGDCIYPTIEDGMLVVTHEIGSMVSELSNGKAMFIPTPYHKDKGYAELIFMWKPDPTKDEERELIVREYVSPNKKQLGIACCLHTKGDGINEVWFPPMKSLMMVAEIETRLQADHKAFQERKSKWFPQGSSEQVALQAAQLALQSAEATQKMSMMSTMYGASFASATTNSSWWEVFAISPELRAMPAITNALPVYTKFTITEKPEVGTGYRTPDGKCYLSFPDKEENHGGKLTIKQNDSSVVFYQDPKDRYSFNLSTNPNAKYKVFKVTRRGPAGRPRSQ